MLLVLIIFLGFCSGSFLNVLIDRLPKGETVIKGRSHCDFCKKSLRWFELIPLLSFIIQRGRCRRCHKKLSLQYPVVELITGLGFCYLYILRTSSLPTLFDNWIIGLLDNWIIYLTILDNWIIFSCLLVIFVADLKYQIISDSMIIIGIISVIMMYMLNHTSYFILHTSDGFLPYLLSALCTSGFFLALWAVTKGRGMGFGDVKLGFLLGLLCGFPTIIFALYIAFLTGALVGVILIISGQKTLKSKVAFGPFLIAGTAIALQWNTLIFSWWKGVL